MFLTKLSNANKIISKFPKFFSNLRDDTFNLTEDQLSIQKLSLDFAQQKLQPFSSEWDQKHFFPVEVIKESSQLGLGGIYTSVEYGGSGLNRLDASLIFESLSQGDITVAAYLSIHNMCNSIVDEFGNEDQKKHWLTRMTSLELLSSYCLTEPNSGSDAAAMKTFAKKEGSDYIINGSKCFISGGSVSDIYIVICKTSEKEISAFIVEKGTQGLSFGKLEQKMGWRASPTTMVMFDDCKIPERNKLSGNGFKIAMKALDGGRINIGSCSLGGATFCLEKAKEYLKSRKQFGKNLSDFQYLQFKLSDMVTNLMASRLMIRNAARMMDSNHKDKTLHSAMAKRFATDHCFDIANYALQMHGGYGYLADYHIERVVRDLRVHQILEGTNEVMRMIISRMVLKD